MVVLWRLVTQEHFVCQLLGPTEDATRRVQFRLLVKIVENTPGLSALIPVEARYSFQLVSPLLGGVVQYMATNVSSAFGDRVDCLWVSDLHAHADLSTYAAWQASLLDSEGSQMLIDANVDDEGGPVALLQKQAEEDPGIFSKYVCYQDYAEYAERAPAWIDRGQAARLEKTSLPPDFRRDILGLRSDVRNSLFPVEVVEACRAGYRAPVVDVKSLVAGRAYRVGAGLDRARSLIAGPKGDSSVWITLAKTASPGGEPEYFVLNCHKFLINSSKLIKAEILRDHERYGLHNVIMENFETADLAGWAAESKVPVELMAATDGNQAASLPELYRIAKEGRLHFPAELEELASEMRTFAYTRRKDGRYTFGHVTAAVHDDHVYALNWAVFSLRKEVLNSYEIDGIRCVNRSGARRGVCFLLGGRLELACKVRCAAYAEVAGQWHEYRKFAMESELGLPDFFQTYVRVVGPVICQAV
jgi:hypothetical protein